MNTRQSPHSSAATGRLGLPIRRAVVYEVHDEPLSLGWGLEQATEVANGPSVETVRTRVAAVGNALDRHVQWDYDMVQVTGHTEVRRPLDRVGSA
jgi:hypothetical protein